jgi:hypothetical protein
MQRACRWGTLLEEGSRAYGEERGERRSTRDALGARVGLGEESCDDWEWEWRESWPNGGVMALKCGCRRVERTEQVVEGGWDLVRPV